MTLHTKAPWRELGAPVGVNDVGVAAPDGDGCLETVTAPWCVCAVACYYWQACAWTACTIDAS